MEWEVRFDAAFAAEARGLRGRRSLKSLRCLDCSGGSDRNSGGPTATR